MSVFSKITFIDFAVEVGITFLNALHDFV